MTLRRERGELVLPVPSSKAVHFRIRVVSTASFCPLKASLMREGGEWLSNAARADGDVMTAHPDFRMSLARQPLADHHLRVLISSTLPVYPFLATRLRHFPGRIRSLGEGWSGDGGTLHLSENCRVGAGRPAFGELDFGSSLSPEPCGATMRFFQSILWKRRTASTGPANSCPVPFGTCPFWYFQS